MQKLERIGLFTILKQNPKAEAIHFPGRGSGLMMLQITS
jgi:hypothetical protein